MSPDYLSKRPKWRKKWVKQLIQERTEGKHPDCVFCKEPVKKDDMDIHHWIPWWRIKQIAIVELNVMDMPEQARNKLLKDLFNDVLAEGANLGLGHSWCHREHEKQVEVRNAYTGLGNWQRSAK